MSTNPPKRANLAAEVRQLVRAGQWRLTRHAQERMLERDVIDLEIEQILSNGTRVSSRDAYDEREASWSYCFQGYTLDERHSRVVVAFDDDDPSVLIVTVVDL